jgi:hypothetical protein
MSFEHEHEPKAEAGVVRSRPDETRPLDSVEPLRPLDWLTIASMTSGSRPNRRPVFHHLARREQVTGGQKVVESLDGVTGADRSCVDGSPEVFEQGLESIEISPFPADHQCESPLPARYWRVDQAHAAARKLVCELACAHWLR